MIINLLKFRQLRLSHPRYPRLTWSLTNAVTNLLAAPPRPWARTGSTCSECHSMVVDSLASPRLASPTCSARALASANLFDAIYHGYVPLIVFSSLICVALCPLPQLILVNTLRLYKCVAMTFFIMAIKLVIIDISI
jgi:hypothetical protein